MSRHLVARALARAEKTHNPEAFVVPKGDYYLIKALAEEALNLRQCAAELAICCLGKDLRLNVAFADDLSLVRVLTAGF